MITSRIITIHELDIDSHFFAGFPQMGDPPNGWFIVEKPIKMDDFGVPHFRKLPYILL
jgi:hypothetical protein